MHCDEPSPSPWTLSPLLLARLFVACGALGRRPWGPRLGSRTLRILLHACLPP